MNEQIRITMYNFCVRGIITEREWRKWCRHYMNTVIMVSPTTVGVMTRLKNR